MISKDITNIVGLPLPLESGTLLRTLFYSPRLGPSILMGHGDVVVFWPAWVHIHHIHTIPLTGGILHLSPEDTPDESLEYLNRLYQYKTDLALFIVSVLLQKFSDWLSNFWFCNIYVGYNFSNKYDYAIITLLLFLSVFSSLMHPKLKNWCEDIAHTDMYMIDHYLKNKIEYCMVDHCWLLNTLKNPIWRIKPVFIKFDIVFGS